MPTNADGSEGTGQGGRDDFGVTYAVDTSVAVPYLDGTHSAHQLCVDTLNELTAEPEVSSEMALSGHAAFETFSVLTRLPGPTRIAPTQAIRALRAAFPGSCWLDGRALEEFLMSLEHLGIVGGMVYDGIVGEAARANGRVLATRDRRAAATYELLGVDYRMIGR